MQPGCVYRQDSPDRFLLVLPVIGLFAIVLRCHAIVVKQKKRRSRFSPHLRADIKPSAVELVSVVTMLSFMAVGLTSEAILCRMKCHAAGNFPPKWAFSICITAYAINYYLMYLKIQSVSKRTRRSDEQRRLSLIFAHLAVLSWVVGIVTCLGFMTVKPYFEGAVERCSLTFERGPGLIGFTLYVLLDLTVSVLGVYLFSKPLLVGGRIKNLPVKRPDEPAGPAPSSDLNRPRKLTGQLTAGIRALSLRVILSTPTSFQSQDVTNGAAPGPVSLAGGPGPVLATAAVGGRETAAPVPGGGLREVALWNLRGVVVGQAAAVFTAAYISVRTGYRDTLVSGWATNYAYVLGVSLMFRDHAAAAALARRAWGWRGRRCLATAVLRLWRCATRRRLRVLPEQGFDTPIPDMSSGDRRQIHSMSARSLVSMRATNENGSGRQEDLDANSCCSEKSEDESQQVFPLVGVSSPELYHILT